MQDLCETVALKYGGSLKAEHGTGRNVAPFVEMEWGTKAYELMWEGKPNPNPHPNPNPSPNPNPNPNPNPSPNPNPNQARAHAQAQAHAQAAAQMPGASAHSVQAAVHALNPLLTLTLPLPHP